MKALHVLAFMLLGVLLIVLLKSALQYDRALSRQADTVAVTVRYEKTLDGWEFREIAPAGFNGFVLIRHVSSHTCLVRHPYSTEAAMLALSWDACLWEEVTTP
jgi:hypothetical protein